MKAIFKGLFLAIALGSSIFASDIVRIGNEFNTTVAVHVRGNTYVGEVLNLSSNTNFDTDLVVGSTSAQSVLNSSNLVIGGNSYFGGPISFNGVSKMDIGGSAQFAKEFRTNNSAQIAIDQNAYFEKSFVGKNGAISLQIGGDARYENGFNVHGQLDNNIAGGLTVNGQINAYGSVVLRVGEDGNFIGNINTNAVGSFVYYNTKFAWDAANMAWATSGVNFHGDIQGTGSFSISVPYGKVAYVINPLSVEQSPSPVVKGSYVYNDLAQVPITSVPELPIVSFVSQLNASGKKEQQSFFNHPIFNTNKKSIEEWLALCGNVCPDISTFTSADLTTLYNEIKTNHSNALWNDFLVLESGSEIFTTTATVSGKFILAVSELENNTVLPNTSTTGHILYQFSGEALNFSLSKGNCNCLISSDAISLDLSVDMPTIKGLLLFTDPASMTISGIGKAIIESNSEIEALLDTDFFTAIDNTPVEVVSSSVGHSSSSSLSISSSSVIGTSSANHIDLTHHEALRVGGQTQLDGHLNVFGNVYHRESWFVNRNYYVHGTFLNAKLDEGSSLNSSIFFVEGDAFVGSHLFTKGSAIVDFNSNGYFEKGLTNAAVLSMTVDKSLQQNQVFVAEFGTMNVIVKDDFYMNGELSTYGSIALNVKGNAHFSNSINFYGSADFNIFGDAYFDGYMQSFDLTGNFRLFSSNPILGSQVYYGHDITGSGTFLHQGGQSKTYLAGNNTIANLVLDQTVRPLSEFDPATFTIVPELDITSLSSQLNSSGVKPESFGPSYKKMTNYLIGWVDALQLCGTACAKANQGEFDANFLKDIYSSMTNKLNGYAIIDIRGLTWGSNNNVELSDKFVFLMDSVNGDGSANFPYTTTDGRILIFTTQNLTNINWGPHPLYGFIWTSGAELSISSDNSELFGFIYTMDGSDFNLTNQSSTFTINFTDELKSEFTEINVTGEIATKYDFDIVSQPTNFTCIEGESAEFSVIVSGNGPYYYEWREDDVSVGPWVQSDYQNTYVKDLCKLDDNGRKYHVLVHYGTQVKKISNEVYLTVIPKSSEIKILYGPESQVIKEGENAEFKVTLSNPENVSFKWVSGNSLTEIVGQTTEKLILTKPSIEEYDGESFQIAYKLGTGNWIYSQKAYLRILPERETSEKITIQSKLYSGNGSSIGNDNPTSLDVSVRLYDKITGGDLKYTEWFLNKYLQGIEVSKGIFKVTLGNGYTENDLKSVVNTNASLYLEFGIGTRYSQEIIAPRIPLTAIPFQYGNLPSYYGSVDPKLDEPIAPTGSIYHNITTNNVFKRSATSWILLK